MPRTFVALLAGTLFGLGLAVSGMMNPAKVVGFLDVAGDWDPTLAFAMGGALLVTIPAFRVILNRPRPIDPGRWLRAADQERPGRAPNRGSSAVRSRLGIVGVLSRLGGPGYGAYAGVRVRRSDAGGNGPLRVTLRAPGPQ